MTNITVDEPNFIYLFTLFCLIILILYYCLVCEVSHQSCLEDLPFRQVDVL